MDQIDVCKIGLAVGTKLSNAGSISLGTAEWEDNSTKWSDLNPAWTQIEIENCQEKPSLEETQKNVSNFFFARAI